MRGGPLQVLLYLVMYPVVVTLLVPMGSAAYASPGGTTLPVAAMSRQQGQLAHPAPVATPAPPVTTVLAASAFDQLRNDLETIAAGSAANVAHTFTRLTGA